MFVALQKSVWIDGDVPECNLLEWVANLKCNLADCFVIVGDITVLAKCKLKSNNDKHSSPSLIFKSGDMVLVIFQVF